MNEPIDLQGHPHVRGNDTRAFRWIVIFIIAMVVLAIALLVVSLYGPNPKLIHSRETTFITEPRRSDGSLDFEKYWYESTKPEGVTVDNNAAVALLNSFYAKRDLGNDLDNVAHEMGATQIGPLGPAVLDYKFNEDFKRFFDTQPGKTKNMLLAPNGEILRAVERVAARVPWTSNDFPVIAQMIDDNAAYFDSLVDASHKPLFWSPSPMSSDGKEDIVWDMRLPILGVVLLECRQLCAVAMYRTGNNQAEEGWEFISAAMRYSESMQRCATLQTELEIAYGIQDGTLDAVIGLVNSGSVSGNLLLRIQESLNSNVLTTIDSKQLDVSRLLAIDASISLLRQRKRDLGYQPPKYLPGLASTRMNWNEILRRFNQEMDGAMSVLEIDGREEQLAAASRFSFAAIDDYNFSNTRSLQSRKYREDCMLRYCLSEFFPRITRVINARASSATKLTVAKLAVALHRYAKDHGSFPNALQDLVPTYRSEIVLDAIDGITIDYTKQNDQNCQLRSKMLRDFNDPKSNEEHIVELSLP
jgi:hypothetical protein